MKYKVIIAGNHDLTFEQGLYESKHKQRFHRFREFDVATTRSFLVGQQKDGIYYLEDEGLEIEGLTSFSHRKKLFLFPLSFLSQQFLFILLIHLLLLIIIIIALVQVLISGAPHNLPGFVTGLSMSNEDKTSSITGTESQPKPTF